jgi:hypothetical protein
MINAVAANLYGGLSADEVVIFERDSKKPT